MALIVLAKEFKADIYTVRKWPVWYRNVLVAAGKRIMGVDDDSQDEQEARKMGWTLEQYRELTGQKSVGVSRG